MGIHVLHVFLIEGQVADTVVADGIPQGLVGSRSLISLTYLSQHIRADASLIVLCLCTEQGRRQSKDR